MLALARSTTRARPIPRFIRAMLRDDRPQQGIVDSKTGGTTCKKRPRELRPSASRSRLGATFRTPWRRRTIGSCTVRRRRRLCQLARAPTAHRLGASFRGTLGTYPNPGSTRPHRMLAACMQSPSRAQWARSEGTWASLRQRRPPSCERAAARRRHRQARAARLAVALHAQLLVTPAIARPTARTHGAFHTGVGPRRL